MKMKRWLHQMVVEQKKWMMNCGETLFGYVGRYHGFYGRSVDEAIAIYEADLQTLRNFEKRLNRLQRGN